MRRSSIRNDADADPDDPLSASPEQRDGVLNRASWEAVAAAQQIGGPVKIVVAGASVGATAKELAAADVAEVIALEHAALGHLHG